MDNYCFTHGSYTVGECLGCFRDNLEWVAILDDKNQLLLVKR